MTDVARVAVPVPLPTCFDFLPPAKQSLPPLGSRVLVPFGRRRLIGVVLAHGVASTPIDRLKAIEQVLDEALIPEDLLAVHAWCARYYAYPPGEAVNLLLPAALRRIKPFRLPPPEALRLTVVGQTAEVSRAPKQMRVLAALAAGPMTRTALIEQGASRALLKQLEDKGWIEATQRPPAPPRPGPELNVDQRRAVAAILAHRHQFAVMVLAGVTGSGKTEVYLRAAQRVVQRGRQVLMLIPEIGLSAQLIRRIEARLGEVAWVYHSSLSAGERLACWHAAAQGHAKVIVGTRSAAFLPLAAPGLIIVDEEHDGSFKQQDGARYHGRDVAVLRARHHDVPIVLGSATPSLESLNNVEAGRYTLLTLPHRAGTAKPPDWQVLDVRGDRDNIAPTLMRAIGRHLEAGGQVLLYRNRRGYAPVLMCPACGWQADCQRCSAHMTWHQSPQRLQCHHCGAGAATPRRCPSCGEPSLLPLGAGTERLEQELNAAFPETPVHRVDRDQLSGRDDFDQLLDTVRQGQPCILVGTQMLAKGHHLPGVTLAAVLDVDQSLFSSDFRAPERLGQIICQVAGRAGRGDQPGTFVLQTRHPEHPLLAMLRQSQYLDYARALLAERHEAGLPPAQTLALIRAEAQQLEAAVCFLQEAGKLLRQSAQSASLQVAGPIAAIMTRRSGYWRQQLWLQSSHRADLVEALSQALPVLHGLPSARRVRWHVDMDPLEL